jgi:fibro-slime domain-containing protein
MTQHAMVTSRLRLRLRLRFRLAKGLAASLAIGLLAACGSSHDSGGGTDAGGSSSDATSASEDAGGGLPGSGGMSFNTGDSGATPRGDAGVDGATLAPGMLMGVIRDFRFYDAGDPSTNPDFENPPSTAMTSTNGWDDTAIVAVGLGTDGKPVYANATGTTLTTHGKTDFDMWYRDVPGTNIHVNYPLPITLNSDGSYGYDSQASGVPYNYGGQTGNGFFPIDDGSPYATAFGNQGLPHNYSFTFELHTVFVYSGGEYFNFRGDDDVFVFINGQRVINLGGIHGPEPGQVNVDDLNLTLGQTYPLDFFSAERHVTGSNIEFETTLVLQSPP